MHGLTVDNLLQASIFTYHTVFSIMTLSQATMVVPDGRILVANETQNSDLFWAIRGAGSNFGVAVEFVYRLHEQRRTVYSGMMIFPPPKLDDLVRVTEDWWEKGPSAKESMQQIYTRGPPPECHVSDIVSLETLLDCECD